jgi:hypothetical protein
MRELSSLRDGWVEIEQMETRLLRKMTIQENLADWLVLQRAFETQLQETSTLFAADRRAALAELQVRLQRLADWQAKRG